MINSGIKLRVFLIAFIPMLFITSFISIYFLQKQLEEIDKNISNIGSAMAMHLANASEYGMFSGNQDNLKTLLHHSIQEEGINSISIIDKSGDLYLSEEKSRSKTGANSINASGTRYFRHPIILHTTNIPGISDFESITDSANNNEILGWIEIAISTAKLDIKRNRIIWDSALIIFTGLVISVLLSLWLGKSITKPILQLTKSVHSIENGNLDEIIETGSSGEIGMLEKGFMTMLGKIRLSQKDLQEKIDETTLGLQNSLKIVEKQNQELTKARTKALEASKTKSRFLANISHEIRTPMNGILGFARLLKKTRLSKEQFDYLDTIEKSSDNLLHLIEDILDISRVEEGKFIINRTSSNLRTCIDDVILLMAPAVLEKGLDITNYYYNDTPSYITAPFERIRQILINFIGNAIKFSEKGTIIIRTMLDPDNDDLLRISVSDEGIGIPDSEKENIFSPFTQVDDTSTRKYEGSGLGLAISKSISKAIGGNVGIEDNVNGGSTFWFSFPYHSNEPAELSSRQANINYSIPVLIYDSNPVTLRSIHADISKTGYSVSEYASLANLVGESKKHKTEHICVLSLSREELSTTTNLLEEVVNLPESRTLFLVRSIDSSFLDRISKYDADICLNRPYRLNELVNSLAILSEPKQHANTGLITEKSSVPGENDLPDIRILLAEDNPINTKLIQTVLKNTGAIIIHANNGEEAVSAFNNNHFDIILMDIQMPTMNGVEATIKIRESGDKGRIIPIIGMTANALPDDVISYRESGFNDILIKPISVDNLLYEINNWIKRPGTQDVSMGNMVQTDDLHYATHQLLNEADGNSLGISKKLSEDLYNMLVEELPEVSSQLQDSYSARNWKSLRMQTHKLLGGISYCNVPGLKKRTLAFQDSLRNQAATLSRDFNALISEIEKLT